MHHTSRIQSPPPTFHVAMAPRRRVLVPDAVTWKGSSFPLSFGDKCSIRVWFAKKAAKLSEEQVRSKRSKKSIGDDDDDGGMEEGAEYEKGDLEVASEAL